MLIVAWFLMFPLQRNSIEDRGATSQIRIDRLSAASKLPVNLRDKRRQRRGTARQD
jgi:hypothetical protein